MSSLNRSQRRSAKRKAGKLAQRELRQHPQPEQQQPESTNMNNGNTNPSARNAIKHGACCTKILIMPNESLEDFQALERRWFKGYSVNPDNPATQFEADLIRAAVRAEWFYLRAEANLAAFETSMPSVADLLRYMRYKTANYNILAKCRKAIEDYRKNRAAEAVSQVKLTITQNRLKSQVVKDAPEETWMDHAVKMKETAIKLGILKPDA